MLLLLQENITQNIYTGTDKSMLMQNTLFRVGGAAMLLANYDLSTLKSRGSNSSSNNAAAALTHGQLDIQSYCNEMKQHNAKLALNAASGIITTSSNSNTAVGSTNLNTNVSNNDVSDIDMLYWFDRSKCSATGPVTPIRYELQTIIRCNLASNNNAYTCVYQTQDIYNNRGVKLDKTLMAVAGDALRKNMQILGPQVLPYSEQMKYGVVMAYRLMRKAVLKQQLLPAAVAAVLLPAVNEYNPNWKTAIQHYAIHAGGRAVIDAIQQGLHLSDYDTEPSRHTLSRYGNTSSSSIWYELLFLEQEGRVKQGEKVWQVAFGSGFKCNSAVWKKC